MADPAPERWRAEHIEMRVELGSDDVVIEATTRVQRVGAHTEPLVLDGRGLDTRAVAVDGCDLDVAGVAIDDRSLTLALSGDEHVVRTVVAVRPGGVADKGIAARPHLISTNCEPEGFRRITWSIDRPASRPTFDVTLVADPATYRTLLANGDLVGEGVLDDGRHWARFVDPVTKPTYLFAFVAGDLDQVRAPYRTRSGREIELRVAATPEQIGGADFALRALAVAMAFDEDHGGIEHDLDTLTFVAIPGYPDATEYHGLMFFEAPLLVVDQRGWSDDDLLLIMANIAHEYGHHVRGNRVTVRSWGQLAMKEGLTVLMGQNDVRRHVFGPVARVLDVLDLRRLQFPEEVMIGAPVVRGEVGNPEQLYTRTTYLKGAEVFGMLRTLVGDAGWATAFATFIDRHDLGAAGVDDVLRALTDTHPSAADDLAGVARWFGLVGRPALSLRVDGAAHSVAMARTDGLADEPPVAMPVVLGFLDRETGEPIAVSVDGGAAAVEHTVVLASRERSVQVTAPRPFVVSPLRRYSAPVDLATDHSADELATLVVHDDDAFARWWAAQELMTRAVDASRAGSGAELRDLVDLTAGALRRVVHAGIEPMLLAQLLTVPDEFMLGDRDAQVDVDGVAAGLAALRAGLGSALHDDLLDLLARTSDDDPLGTTATDIAQRSLVEPCLALALATGSAEAIAAAEAQLRHPNHTRAVRALSQVLHLDQLDASVIDGYVGETLVRWQGAPKLLDRWLRAQSGGRRHDTIERVRALRDGPLYDRHDRGRVMGLWFPFATRNRSLFHRSTGEGYRLFADEVIVLLPINAGVVIRLVGDLMQFGRFDAQRSALMRAELERIAGAPGLPDFAVGILRHLLAT